MLRDLPRLGRRISDEESLLIRDRTDAEESHDSHQYQTSRDILDDVFGSRPSSPDLSNNPHQIEHAEHSDIPRLRSIHVTNGYREGIAVSKEQYIQEGFDEGYGLGGEIGMRAGWCLGVLQGIYAALKKAQNSTQYGERNMAPISRVQTMYAHAQEALKLDQLLGPEHFGEDGIWLYDVSGQDRGDEELQVSFKDVAAAHPTLTEWIGKIMYLAEELDLRLS